MWAHVVLVSHPLRENMSRPFWIRVVPPTDIQFFMQLRLMNIYTTVLICLDSSSEVMQIYVMHVLVV